MLSHLDRRSPTGLAVPTLLLSGGGLVALGVWRPVWALAAGALGLGIALFLALSARWRLAGNPDPVAAGVEFSEEADRSSHAVMIGFLVIGIAVAVAGLLDLADMPAPRPAKATQSRVERPARVDRAPATVADRFDAPASKSVATRQLDFEGDEVVGELPGPDAGVAAGQVERDEGQRPANGRASRPARRAAATEAPKPIRRRPRDETPAPPRSTPRVADAPVSGAATGADKTEFAFEGDPITGRDDPTITDRRGGFGAAEPRTDASNRARAPKFSLSAPNVSGDLTVSEVRRALSRYRNEFGDCIESAARRAPTLNGRVHLKLVIGATGKVSRAWVGESTLKNRPAEACLIKRLQRGKFPRPRSGGLVKADFTITVKTG